MKRLAFAFVLLALAGCRSRPACEEPLPPGTPDDTSLAVAVSPEPRAAKLVHLVTFEMGPIVETLQGYAVVRVPDAFRLYGMAETGQRAFEVAYVHSGDAPPRTVGLYRAPFLRDDRILDLIARASARIFLERPPITAFVRDGEAWVREHAGVEYRYAGPTLELCEVRGDGYGICFMDWGDEGGARFPHRVHYRSTEGPYPYELRMKLVRAQALRTPPPDALFQNH